MLANTFTKPLPSIKAKHFATELGLCATWGRVLNCNQAKSPAPAQVCIWNVPWLRGHLFFYLLVICDRFFLYLTLFSLLQLSTFIEFLSEFSLPQTLSLFHVMTECVFHTQPHTYSNSGPFHDLINNQSMSAGHEVVNNSTRKMWIIFLMHQMHMMSRCGTDCSGMEL